MSNRFWYKTFYRNTDGALKLVAQTRDTIVTAATVQNVSLYYGDVVVKCDGLVILNEKAWTPNGEPRERIDLLARRIEAGYIDAQTRRRNREFARDAQRAAKAGV